MSRGVNKVILVGNVGSTPDQRAFSGGNVTSFSLATSESWKDKNTGAKQERTEWHKVSCFGRLADIAGEYLRQGSKVYIEGKIRTEKWQDKTGADRYTTKIIANELVMLGDKPSGQQAPPAPSKYTTDDIPF